MIDFLSDQTRRDPFPEYDRIRANSPVVYDPRSDAWMVFDYAGVKRVLTDSASFSSSVTPAPLISKWLIFSDAPRHAKLRALIARAFTPVVIANLEPRVCELTQELLAPALERGAMDIATEFSTPLPMLVIAEMLGVPGGDWQRFREWAETILKLSYVTGGDTETMKTIGEEFRAVTAEMRAYLSAVLEERRSMPRDDLLTKLLLAEMEGERLTHDEILGFFQLLLIAGTETTTNLLNNAMLCLIEHPEELQRLRSDPGLLVSAIEEILRYRSPVQWMFRITTREIELDRRLIPPGKLILPMIGSANRDPRQFSEPRRFHIGREPNPHLAFGYGAHFCLGAPLSRLEARVALCYLLRAMKNIRLRTDEPWQPRTALHVYGPATLPIVFEPAEVAATA